MKYPHLSGKRVMVVEDELLVAIFIEDVLADAECIVVGPFSRVQDALVAAESELIDFAIMDVNVSGIKVFPVAYQLEKQRRAVFVFDGLRPSCIAPGSPGLGSLRQAVLRRPTCPIHCSKIEAYLARNILAIASSRLSLERTASRLLRRSYFGHAREFGPNFGTLAEVDSPLPPRPEELHPLLPARSCS